MNPSKVAECVADVRADLERQGQLDIADVQRLVDQHALDGAEISAVFAALRLDEIVPQQTERDPWPSQREVVAKLETSRDMVGQILHSAGRVRLLTAEEEVSLGRRIRIGQELSLTGALSMKDGDEAKQIAEGKRAHEHLVLANLRLVISIARRVNPTGMELSDLIQEGTIGLMRAADKFDHSLGYKFSTYATWWIRQSIQRAQADKGRIIRLPVHVMEKVNRIRAVEGRIRTELDRNPTAFEVAEELGENPADVQALMDIARDPVSLDRPLVEETDADLGDILNLYTSDVAEEVVESITKLKIGEALEEISLLQAHSAKGATVHAVAMLRLRYGIGHERDHTLDEVGAAFGITRERVRQIVKKLIESPQIRMHLYEFVDLN